MKCSICGREDHPDHYYDEYRKPMEENHICFHCAFWKHMLEEDSKRPPHTACMIDGVHYIIEPDKPNTIFQGFGGAEFQIEFNDGTRIITHNLWCQGEPDEHWKQLFPDNAHFERNLKWVDIYGTKHLIEENEN